MQLTEKVFQKLVESASKTAIARILYEVSEQYYVEYLLSILADGKVIREDDIDVNTLATYVESEYPDKTNLHITGYKIDNLQKRIVVSYADAESEGNTEYIQFKEYGLR